MRYTGYFGNRAQIFFLGTPINEDGDNLPPNTKPPHLHADAPAPDDWAPFINRPQFELGDFLYCQDQMPATRIDQLLDIWGSWKIADTDPDPPFGSHNTLYELIDSICHGKVPWQSFSMHYNGACPDANVPPWMDSEYDMWFRDPCLLLRNQIANPAFAGQIDYAPIQEYNDKGQRTWTDFMTGNWAWRQAVRAHIYIVEITPDLSLSG